MVPKKAKSKRITLKQKVKVRHKVAEHNRKTRRDLRRNPQLRKKFKKDPGIPSLFPRKEQVLREAEDYKMRIEEEREQRRIDKKKQQNGIAGIDGDCEMEATEAVSDETTFAEMASKAALRSETFERETQDQEESIRETTEAVATGRKDNSKKAYMAELQRVVEMADVVLEVVDARDPIGTRASGLGRMIEEAPGQRRHVLVLNKADLVPRAAVEGWAEYLRHSLPVLPYRSSTQEQRRNLQASDGGASATALLQLLKNYGRKYGMKGVITVGVVGLPNVGKSSIINSLKRSRACAVGATPGITRAAQLVSLDSTVRLLDSPGVVLVSNPPKTGDAKTDALAAASVLLRNCIKVGQLDDPISPAHAVILRCGNSALERLYGVPACATPDQFLIQLARRSGRLRRGGTPVIADAARTLLTDWFAGKIPYYIPPPAASATELGKSVDEGEARIVDSFAPAVDMDALFAALDAAVDSSEAAPANDPAQNLMSMPKRNMPTEADNLNASLPKASVVPVIDQSSLPVGKSSAILSTRSSDKLAAIDPQNPQTNRTNKAALKTANRLKRRNNRGDIDSNENGIHDSASLAEDVPIDDSIIQDSDDEML